MKILLIPVFLFVSFLTFSQGADLGFGKVVFADLEMKSYLRDTLANAVVLNEIGSSYISDQTNEGLIFQRYQKIKIIKKEGFDQANFEIRLHKQGNAKEHLVSVVASTYNLVEGKIKEMKLDPKNIFTENRNNYLDLIKFTLPDIREGSVLEVLYKLNSPFYYYSFRPWEFQSDIPKVHSEYSALIPGNFVYSITLKGFRSLKKNESSIVKDCFNTEAGRSECSLSKYAMDDIPAFMEEDWMTARSNFTSSIRFQLSEFRDQFGKVNKATKEWKDVDLELRQRDDFGAQIRKAKNLFDDKIKSIVLSETDTLKKAKGVYDFIKRWYTWNNFYSIVTDLGVKKAFDSKKGNAADINLSLVGALQSAGLVASPVILSTRENGLPSQIHPVITDFDYVIASTDIDGKTYLLDATSDYQPFGLLPIRCLNGKGRLMAKESYWIDLKPRDKKKSAINIDLVLSDGGYEGTFILTYQGYDALAKRTEIVSALGTSKGKEINTSRELSGYTSRLQTKWKEIEIVDYKVTNLDSVESPLEEKFTVKINLDQPAAGTILFNPFVVDKWELNPFKSSERLYPVDFEAPLEQVRIIKLTYPDSYRIDDLPSPAALTLPQSGGRFLFNIANLGNSVTITSNLTLNRSVYNSGEYGAIKEFFGRLVQINQSQIVIKKK